MRTRTHRLALAAGTALTLAGLTACSGGGSGGSGGSGGGDQNRPDSATSASALVAAPQAGPLARGMAQPPSAIGAKRAQVHTAAVIRTGTISLTSRHLSTVRREVDGLLTSLGGSVDHETTSNDRSGAVRRSTLVLRVPVARFEAAKDALERLGTLKSSTESSKDVTTEVIDTAERVQTLQNSLDRLQRFQRSATDVKDLISFEEQITTRTSELQSLKAQQTYLSGQTSMSTITLRLSTPKTYVAPPGALHDAGFLSGLRGGWSALVGAVVVALTGLGALMPFLVVVLVLGVPTWLLLRRRATPTP